MMIQFASSFLHYFMFFYIILQWIAAYEENKKQKIKNERILGRPWKISLMQKQKMIFLLAWNRSPPPQLIPTAITIQKFDKSSGYQKTG